jgi:hypothetical protein
LENCGDFHPRKKYLEHAGRKNFLNRALDSFPYYERALPDYVRGNHVENLWLDLAMQENYQLSLHDFTYDRNLLLSKARGLERIDELLKFFFGRFGIRK